jgi:hypothetical protein
MACMNHICYEFDGVRGKRPQKFPNSYVQKSKWLCLDRNKLLKEADKTGQEFIQTVMESWQTGMESMQTVGGITEDSSGQTADIPGGGSWSCSKILSLRGWKQPPEGLVLDRVLGGCYTRCSRRLDKVELFLSSSPSGCLPIPPSAPATGGTPEWNHRTGTLRALSEASHRRPSARSPCALWDRRRWWQPCV